MTEQVEQWICIKFCVKLEHSSAKLFGYSEGRSYGKMLIGSFITTMCPLMHHVSCRGFWQNITSPRWLSPPAAQILCPATSGFSQNLNHLWKGRDSDHWWDSGKYDRAEDGDWENCVRSQGAYFEGDWGAIVLCTMFLVSCIFSNKCLYFSYYMAGYLLDRPHLHVRIWKYILTYTVYVYSISQ